METLEKKEQEKYKKIWENKDYRKYAPGETLVDFFIKQVNYDSKDSIIDYGCGTGRAGFKLALYGFDVTLLDITDNSLDKDIKDIVDSGKQPLKFQQANIWEDIPCTALYGYCTDVMEHIPPEKVDITLKNILSSSRLTFFQICLKEDHFGSTIGDHLHLTVRPFEWWLKKLNEYGHVIFSHNQNNVNGIYLVSGWTNAKELIRTGVLNTETEVLLENIKENSKKRYNQVKPHDRQEKEVILLGGGPSLKNFEKEIIEKRKQGMPLVTTNGTYNWTIEKGLSPSAQIIVDAREFNIRFLNPIINGCKYLLASQCHPSLLEKVPKDQLYMWHAAVSKEAQDYLDLLYDEWYPVPGGSTVMLRAFPLLRMLGFYKFHIYGFDSCLTEKEHHAYKQPENEYKKVIQVNCGNRIFDCHAWMASQAQEFIDLIGMLGDEIKLAVYGDGLISHILRTGADIIEKGELTNGCNSLDNL